MCETSSDQEGFDTVENYRVQPYQECQSLEENSSQTLNDRKKKVVFCGVSKKETGPLGRVMGVHSRHTQPAESRISHGLAKLPWSSLPGPVTWNMKSLFKRDRKSGGCTKCKKSLIAKLFDHCPHLPTPPWKVRLHLSSSDRNWRLPQLPTLGIGNLKLFQRGWPYNTKRLHLMRSHALKILWVPYPVERNIKSEFLGISLEKMWS